MSGYNYSHHDRFSLQHQIQDSEDIWLRGAGVQEATLPIGYDGSLASEATARADFLPIDSLNYAVGTSRVQQTFHSPLPESDAHQGLFSSSWGYTYTQPPAYTLNVDTYNTSPTGYIPSADFTPSLAETCHISGHPRVRTNTFEHCRNGLDSRKNIRSIDGVDGLKRRSSQRSSKGLFICTRSDCEREFRSHDNYRRHEQTVHINHKDCKGYRCAIPDCSKADKIWTRLDNFKLHLAKKHGIEKNSPRVHEMVHQSSRSSRGSEARFPFVEVTPGNSVEQSSEATELSMASSSRGRARSRFGRTGSKRRRMSGSQYEDYWRDTDIVHTRSDPGYTDSGYAESEPDWASLINEDY